VKRKQQTTARGGPKETGRRTDNPLVAAFSMRLRGWRQEQGITLKAVALEMGVCISIVSEWEHGNRFPSVDNLWSIAQFTGIPAPELIRPVKSAEMNKRRP
jgi:transcriptional regulator with XRE-family HTH domain